MELRLTKELIAALGPEGLKEAGIPELQRPEKGGPATVPCEIASLDAGNVARLVAIFLAHEKVRGATVVLKDIAAWQKILNGETDARAFKPRTVEQFSSMLTALIARTSPQKRMYLRDAVRDPWCAVYVERVTYHPRHTNGAHVYPAQCTVTYWWREFGEVRHDTKSWEPAECEHKDIASSLDRFGMALETEELRAQYARDAAFYASLHGSLGQQFYGTGCGTTDVDGNPSYMTSALPLTLGDQPSTVVLDVDHEEEPKRRGERPRTMGLWFWTDPQFYRVHWDRTREDRDLDDLPAPEVPLWPMRAVFDLQRHARLKVHVGQLQPKPSDPTLRDKLVIPAHTRAFVEMLVARKGGFRDVIAGKGAGTVLLLCGLPGVGKTLTAEVYAEATGKPLYTVHASQLGVSPVELEANLLRVFRRAERWGAILLLDEADVYVAARGTSLTQNAIVGVFLRVLEYFRGILFLTTNRAESVDDAIASRCLARIRYDRPIADEQARIWRILADTAGVALDEPTLAEAVKTFPSLTGRDVRNMLALAAMIAEAKKKHITIGEIIIANHYKPTPDGAS